MSLTHCVLAGDKGGSFFIVAEAALCGRRLRKSFGQCLYSGGVDKAVLVSAGPATPPLPCYRVIYDDGDCEDLTLQEARQLIIWGGQNAAIRQLPVQNTGGRGSKRQAHGELNVVPQQHDVKKLKSSPAATEGEWSQSTVIHLDIGNSCEEVVTAGNWRTRFPCRLFSAASTTASICFNVAQ